MTKMIQLQHKIMIRIAATIVIALLLSIPAYTAVSASSLKDVKTSGADGIEGFRKARDKTIISVTAEVTGDSDVTPNQVLVESVPFSSCAKDEAEYTYTCSYEGDENDLMGGENRFSVTLKDDAGNSVATSSATLTVDNKPPKISLNIPELVAGNVGAQFSANDPSPCSGIANVEFYSEDLTKPIGSFESNKSSCTLTGTQVIQLGQGRQKVCAVAYDALGQGDVQGYPCVEFSVDNTPPKIIRERLNITTALGARLMHMPVGGVPINIQLTIKEAESGLGAVKADLSVIGDSERSPDSCVEKAGEGVYICTWKNVKTNFRESTTAAINVSISDKAGNTASETLGYEFVVDATPPRLVQIQVENGIALEGDVILVGSNMSYAAQFDEAGSGMSPEQAFMDFSGVNSNSRVKANECRANVCRWLGVDSRGANGATASIGINPETTDVVGNRVDLGEAEKLKLRLDTQAPRLKGINMTPTTDNRLGPGEVLQEDSVSIEAILDEYSPAVYARADFSRFSNELVEGRCSKDDKDGLWKCTINSPKLESPGKGEVTIEFYDAVNNRVTVKKEINLLAKNTAENPDYWVLDGIERMPEFVDRQTTGFYEYRVYFHVMLKAKSPGTSILEQKLAECEGDTKHIKSAELFFESEEPFVIITLRKQAMPNASITLNCPLELHSRFMETIAVNPEIEPLELKIEFYNLPLGEFGESISSKIESARREAVTSQEWIGTADSFIKIGKRVCSGLMLMKSIVTALNDIGIKIDALDPLVAGPTYDRVVGQVNKGANEGLINKLYDYCRWFSCGQGTWFTGWYNKVIDTQTDNLLGENTKNWLSNRGIDDATVLPRDPEESIVLSTVTGCVPGIISNLQKYRQIQCQYIICMRKAALENMQIHVCEDERAYLQCRFWWGQAFELVPFAHFVRAVGRNLRDIVSDPLGLVFGITAGACELMPPPPSFICRAANLIKEAVILESELRGVTSDWSLKGDVCQEALRPMGKKK